MFKRNDYRPDDAGDAAGCGSCHPLRVCRARGPEHARVPTFPQAIIWTTAYLFTPNMIQGLPTKSFAVSPLALGYLFHVMQSLLLVRLLL
jgi:hypothetical protein